MPTITSYGQIFSSLVIPKKERGDVHANLLEMLEAAAATLGGASLGLIVYFLLAIADEEQRESMLNLLLIGANVSEILEFTISIIKIRLSKDRERTMSIAMALSNGIATSTVIAGSTVYWAEDVPHTRIPAILFFSGMTQRVAVTIGKLIYACASVVELENKAENARDKAEEDKLREQAAALQKKYIDNLPEHLHEIAIKSLGPIVVLTVLVLGIAETHAMGIGLTFLVAGYCIGKFLCATRALVGNCIGDNSDDAQSAITVENPAQLTLPAPPSTPSAAPISADVSDNDSEEQSEMLEMRTTRNPLRSSW